jgi:hypothetical protein
MYTSEPNRSKEEAHRNVTEAFGNSVKLMMSDGNKMYLSFGANNTEIALNDNTKTGEVLRSDRDNSGYIFARVRTPNGKYKAVRLNSRLLSPKEVSTVWEITKAMVLEGKKPSEVFKDPKSNIVGLTHREALNLLIYNGPKSVNSGLPFNIDFTNKKILLGEAQINFADLTEDRVKAYVETMKRTTNSFSINKTMATVKTDTFMFFGREITPETSYNEFMYADKALQTNIIGEAGKVFKKPRIELSKPETYIGEAVAPKQEEKIIPVKVIVNKKTATKKHNFSAIVKETPKVLKGKEVITDTEWEAYEAFGASDALLKSIETKLETGETLSPKEEIIALAEKLKGSEKINEKYVSLKTKMDVSKQKLIDAGFTQEQVDKMTPEQIGEEFDKHCKS